MKQLVLFRHAKAQPAEDDSQDFERALAPVGRADAPRIAELLAATGVAPEVALVSAARRTQETWALAAPFFPGAQVRVLPDLYLAPADALLEQALAAGASRVMIVAHNPGLQDLAIQLCPTKSPEATRLQRKFPTAAAAVFMRASPKGTWTIEKLLTPSDDLP